MNGASGLRAGKQLFGRRPVGRQGARRVRQRHTAARSAAGGGGSGPLGGAGSSSSSNTGTGAAAGNRFGWAKWVLLPAAASALFGGKAAADAYSTVQTQLDVEAGHKRAERSLAVAHSWIEEICSQPGCVKAIDAEMLTQDDHPILEDDHMFSAFVSKGIVDDLTGYYNTQQRKFYSIISLGREVCGFPRIVHGGLTAAIIDESFGGLLFALKKQRALPFWGPAYTVHLEIQYKSKIEAGRTILCTTEVESQEGRKLWMKATVSDGPQGTVYATARALFVAPRPQKALVDVGKYLLRRVMGDM